MVKILRLSFIRLERIFFVYYILTDTYNCKYVFIPIDSITIR